MTNDRIQLSLGAEKFAMEMEEARRIAKVPELFRRTWLPREKADEICVLRRWNSHTPSVWNVWGGGYFLWWRGRGTVVDPGCSFTRVLRSETPYEVGDIDMAVATHDHVDHCQDFSTLISLFRGYNKWLTSNRQPPRTWDLVMSHGVADQFNSLLIHPENLPFLRWSKVLPPKELERVQWIPSFGQSKAPEEMASWKPHIREHLLYWNQEITEEYGYSLGIIPAIHKELLGEYTSMGLRFTLNSDGVALVISGDTAYDPDLVKYYRHADLLALHVGTMERTSSQKLPEHLGLFGVVEILKALEDGREKEEDMPKLVVLTEWGYEFGRLRKPGELRGRARFSELVVERLRDMGCHSYFAAVSCKRTGDGNVPIIPADLSLRISLPDLRVWSEDENGGEGGFVSPDRIWAEDKGDEIIFHTVE